MADKRCLFISHENDLHAAVVAKWLRHDYDVATDIVSANVVAGQYPVSFYQTLSSNALPGILDPDRYDLVWARRMRLPQKATENLDETARAFVNAECRAAFEGALMVARRPIMVNPLEADRRANNKIWQLQRASELGFAVPQTLCSNDPDAIRAFSEARSGAAVIKKLQGITDFTPLTLEVVETVLGNDEALRASPLLVQARIDAACHYRVHVFGDAVYAFRIVSDVLDWRPNAGRGARACELDCEVEQLCQAFVREAGLLYGILDLIEDRAGIVYFLECNPQGQFLFMEQRSGVPIGRFFARYLAALMGIEAREMTKKNDRLSNKENREEWVAIWSQLGSKRDSAALSTKK